ncbi:uncharacterized protein [Rutidosis leptorrhynchoides]|uniref:uncharacterized protein isoform X2 n=1 Tax=Rutidosis leptorrhynchoides TaxID=125765 RepID=UPI003A995610
MMQGIDILLAFVKGLSSSEDPLLKIHRNSLRRSLKLITLIGCSLTLKLDMYTLLIEVNTSHIQLLGNVSKAKNIIVELENLVEDVKLALEAAIETEYISNLDPISPTSNEDDIVSIVPEKPKDVDYATMVAVVYSMVKQDYVMQEKIVTSLNLNTSSGELESYCLMWSLRPFINDEIMHQAWKLIS